MPRILDGPAAALRDARSSIKWRRWGPGVLPLWVAEMDARPCPAVVEAVTAAVARGDTGYAVEGRYAAAASRFAADRWGWEIDPSATRGVADVMIGVEAVLRQVCTPGGSVVVSPPVYDSFFGFIAATGRRRVDAPLNSLGRIDLEALESAFAAARAPRERSAYLLCNPQNPTGTVHTRDELAALTALAVAYDITVVSDEIHAPLVYGQGPPFTPWLTVSTTGFSVWSASKAWNLAGFKEIGRAHV